VQVNKLIRRLHQTLSWLKLRIPLRLTGILVLIVLSSQTVVSAQDMRGIFYEFYDPTSRECALGGGSLSTDGVMSINYPGFSDETYAATQIDAFIRKYSPDSPWLSIPSFAQRLVTESKTRNVNPLMIVVIGRQESQLGTSRVAREDRNPANFNSFGNKGNPDVNRDDYREWPSFEGSLFGDNSFTAAVQKRITGGHPSYVNVKNMYEYLSVHVSGRIIYAGDNETRVFDETMGEWVDITGVQNYYKNAQEWIGEMSGQTISLSPAGAVSDCSGSGAVNGSITSTALAFAWTETAKVSEIMAAVDATDGLCTMEGDPTGCGRTKAAAGAFIRERDARAEYVTAVKQFNQGNDSDGSNWAFSDCGVFVATVMRASGVDNNYAARGTGPNQLPYVRDSGLYDTVLFTDTSQLQPGDILIKDGHTAIYVGQNQQTDAVVVQASWGQNVPAANQSTVTPGDGYYRARRVQL
jgi:hypothetical protein